MKKLKTFIISILTLSCILSLSGVFAYADMNDDKLKTEIFTPSSYQEYFALSSPTDIYYDSEITAVLEATKLDNGQEQTRLVLYSNGLYKTKTFNFTLTQLCRFGNFLVTTKESRPYLIDVNTLELSQEKINDTDGNEIDVHCFSSNGNYFVKKNASGIAIYKVTPQQNTVLFEKLTDKDVNSITGVASSPNLNRIAINNDNYIFCFNTNGKLSSYKFYEDGQASLARSYEFTKLDGIINDIIADNDYFYILSSSSLQKMSVTDETSPTNPKYLVNEENKIDDLLSPSSMVFKNGNLLIADHNCNKIIELSSEDFAYTGFAITTTANANNRLTADTKDISVSGENVAVLNGENGFTVINKNTYAVYGDLKYNGLTISAEKIALGKTKVALTVANKLYFVDLETKAVTPVDLKTNETYPITSITYASGKFYLSTYQKVFIVSEDGEEVNSRQITLSLNNLLTADVDGNFYVYSKDNDNNNIVTKYDFNGTSGDVLTLTGECKKLGVDFNGNVYALLNDNVVEYFKNGVKKSVTLELSPNLPVGSKATAMAISYDSKNVYFLFNGKGFILSTEFAENDAITDVTVPTDFALTGETANGVDTLKIYNLKTNANVYVITDDYSGENFVYKELAVADESDYVYAGKAYCSTDGGNHPLLALVNQNRLILIKESDAVYKEVNLTADITNGFTNTKFNLYYLPVLTPNESYALNAAALEKSVAISVTAEVKINGRSFYHATANGVSGYIIKDAVTEKLANQFARNEFTYKTLKPAKIYKDATMGDVLTETDANLSVRATKGENDAYYIEFTLENGDIVCGFVNANAFLREGKNAVRNAVIIGILALSVTATSIFFLYRKRR